LRVVLFSRKVKVAKYKKCNINKTEKFSHCLYLI